MTTLVIQNLHVEYPGKLLFGDVNMKVEENEIVAIRTEVLDGGTSLLRAIGGYLNGVEGHVFLDDVDLLEDTSSAIKHSVGYVYETNGLVSLYDVLHNIGLPLKFHTDMTAAEIAAAVAEVGDLLRLDPDIYALQTFELNDVQTRLVTLARALVTKPRLLLIDELEGGMSDEYLAATMATLRERQRAEPMPIVMTTSSEVILEAADRTFRIEDCDVIPLEPHTAGAMP